MDFQDISAPFVLLDDNRHDPDGVSYLFHRPERIIKAHTIAEARQAFHDMDAAVAAGFFVAGWVAYECAAVFEDVIARAVKTLPEEPLVWMMVTRERLALQPEAAARFLNGLSHGDAGRLSFLPASVDKAGYTQALARIKDYIAAGDVYQVNYTFMRRCMAGGDAATLYKELRAAQPVQYGAYIQTCDDTIMSFSPELFIRRTGNQLVSKPMKGTAPRDGFDDADQAHRLSEDAKSRAENLMIVDLIRNDMSRVAKAGSVGVENLFAVETLPSLHQMTSTVHAECAPDLTPSALFAALFPCGSVTGAPKIRAMEIIAALEKAPRGVYCGAIGHFSPATADADINWCFNVPIRTMILKTENSPDHGAGTAQHKSPAVLTGQMGIGSGIVADSDLEAEYRECLLKARFTAGITDRSPFQLIETMRVEGGRILLLDRHMDRLAVSAAALGFVCSLPSIKAALFAHARDECGADCVYRLRLALSPDGSVTVSSNLLAHLLPDAMPRVCFATMRIDASDSFRLYKTTVRSLYDAAAAWAVQNGFADVLFLNQRDEVAEGAISNVFLEIDGALYTPPICSGALPGVLRASLLDGADRHVEEKSLTVDEMIRADRVFIGNALRGLRQVSVCQQTFYNQL